MKKPQSSNRIKSASVFVAIVVLFLFVAFQSVRFVSYYRKYGEMHDNIDPYSDTTFTDQFSFEKFGAIKAGMTVDEVLELIGEPLQKRIPQGTATNKEGWLNFDESKDCWQYSSDGKLGTTGDASWYSYVVCFKDQKVEGTYVNEFSD